MSDFISSLPLKKRPIRNDFTDINNLATPYVPTSVLYNPQHSSFERSSPTFSIQNDSGLTTSSVFSPRAVLTANSPFSSIDNMSVVQERANRITEVQTSSRFLLSTLFQAISLETREPTLAVSIASPTGSSTDSTVDSGLGSPMDSASSSASDSSDSSSDSSSVKMNDVESNEDQEKTVDSMGSTEKSEAPADPKVIPIIHCPACSKKFVGRAKYQAHLRRHRSKWTGRYQCFKCAKSFVQKSSLITHVRTHTGERPYKCNYEGCNEAFSDLSTFTKHRRTHTGEKPYVCPACDRAFSQSGNMHRHFKAVHGKKGKKSKKPKSN